MEVRSLIREWSVLRVVWTSELFESEHNVLQCLHVRNLAQRWSLQLRQCSLDGVWIHSFQDAFQNGQSRVSFRASGPRKYMKAIRTE